MEKKLALSFEVGEAIGDESGAYRRHRVSCELNVVYLVVGCTAAALVIGTVLWLALANPQTNQNSFIKQNQTNTIVDAKTKYRLDYVRNLTRDEWNVHLRFYLNKGSTNQTWHNSSDDLHQEYGFQVIQSMSTLWVVNLQEEFAHSKTWIKPFIKLSFHPSVLKIVTQYVGSLESCYALTGNESFLNEAKEGVNVLKKAHYPNGVPWYSAFADSTYHDPNNCRLDQLSPYLEYRYMADLTHDSQLDTILSKYRTILKSWPKTNGVYNSERTNGNAVDSLYKFLYHSELFYSYVIKSYIQSNYTDHESNSMFNQAIEALETADLREKSDDVINNPAYYCYLGTVFGLRAWAKNRSRVDDDAALMKKHLNWAVHFTEKCHHVTVNETETSLDRNERTSWIMRKERYLSAHRAECYFVLYRLTGDPKYRDYAWVMVQHINTFLEEAEKIFKPPQDHHRPDKFMKSTLKFLYLIFAEENLLSLDQWVFNNDGQPLPICGHNRMYPGVKCGGKLGVIQ